MSRRRSIWWRLRLVVGLTTVLPLVVAVLLAKSMVEHTAGRFFLPEIGAHLDQALGLYQDLAHAMKASLRHQATVLAAHEPLRRAAAARDAGAARRELAALLPRADGLVSLAVVLDDGEELARVDRGHPLDAARENALTVVRPLAGDPLAALAADRAPPSGAGDPAAGADAEAAAGPTLVAIFAADRSRFDERDRMSGFLDTYRHIERRRAADEQTYVLVFALLLCLTVAAAIGVGGAVARGIVVHVRRLDAATRRVAAGDLAVRVPESGPEELAGLARAFNRMLDEVEASRARIEYLQRIAAWQELARRLAHEIKNPLTPIQLAVQEVHRRYRGDDATYRGLLRETLEMVEAEVRTLHRLVTEFSDFARLPHPALKVGDLAAFLREQQERLQWVAAGGDEASAATRVTLEVEVPGAPARASFDAEMLGRALLNLVLNARQAMELAGQARGRITLTLQRDLEYLVLDVDDDGPGIPDDLRDTVFDPYVTTKAAGTGLGLAIVKKVVIEHGGTIVILTSPAGGARVRLRLPAAGTAAAVAASEWRPPPPSRPYHERPLEPDA